MNTKSNCTTSLPRFFCTVFFLLTLLLTGCTDTLVSYEDTPQDAILTEEAAWQVQDLQAVTVTPNDGRMMETDRLVKRHNHRSDVNRNRPDLELNPETVRTKSKLPGAAPMSPGSVLQ